MQDNNFAESTIDINNYPSLNTLLFFQRPRGFYRPILFSQNEVFCGPDCQTKKEGEYFRTIQTPVGIFDIKPILNQLPASQKPDLVIVKADAGQRVFPVNLDQFNCPKLLMTGDTHHLERAIQNILIYAKEEKFDYVMSIPNPHHLHYFKEAGFEKTFWIPTFHIAPHPQITTENDEHLISFVGQAGEFHPYRQYILNQVKEAEFPLNQVQAQRPEAAKIYANSLINLNISLNGDLNMRVFEVLSSGGFLLTDRLSQQTRLEKVLDEGKHFVAYNNETDLLNKIEYYTNNPKEARQIATQGEKVFWKNHRPELNVKRIIDYMDGKEIEPWCYAEWDQRSIYAISDNTEQFTGRIAIYEYIQQLHCVQPHLQGLCFPKVNSRVICDLTDLPRLNLYVLEDSESYLTETKQTLNRCSVVEQVIFTDSPRERKWDFLAITVAELNNMDIHELIKNIQFNQLIITDFTENLCKVCLLDDFLPNYGLIKCYNNPLVYQWSIKDKLNLRQVNLIIFPDWNQSEEKLSLDFANLMKAISNHPDHSQITFVLDTDNLSEEDANLMLSGVAMNLMMEEGIELSEQIEISFTGSLDDRDWKSLLPNIQGRLKLDHENIDKISRLQADQFPIYETNLLNQYRVMQSQQGIWNLYQG